MLRSLRSRLILSHTLPLLISTPLVGIILTYFVETQVMLPSMTSSLTNSAVLTAKLLANQPATLKSAAAAAAFVEEVTPLLSARLMLLDAHGRLIASSNTEDSPRLGIPFTDPWLEQALNGKFASRIIYSNSPGTDAIQVWMPVLNSKGEVVAVLNLSRQLENVLGDFLRLRLIIALALLAGLLLGVTMGWRLAVSLELPLGRLTSDVNLLASGAILKRLPESGPDEIRSLSRSVNLLSTRLQDMEQSRRHLLANLVHEVGRPLGAIRSAVHALISGADQQPELRLQLLEGIALQTQGLERLLDDLTRLHDQALGALEMRRVPTNLSGWLQKALVPWQAAAKAKGLEWAVYDPGLPRLDVDPDRLTQALGNLLSNAIKFTPQGGRVEVRARAASGQVCLEVQDSGPGLDDQERERIFTPFFRGSQGQRFPRGMGLGLSIAREIIAAHGGELKVQSAGAAGTCFALCLPLPDAPPSNSAGQA
jgi:two-component system sensor histidine kinase BaeS